ncbi:MAG: sigma-70 family RNA polymerase sigma factor, partial [Myxococcota bacterium]
PPSDAELLAQWRDGDLRAGEALFHRYYATVERFFLNKLSSGVGDLVQDTFRACVEARDQVADPTKFRAYLFSIAYNQLRSHLRRKQRRGVVLDVDEVTAHALDPGPSSVLARRREERLLLDGLRNIPIADQVLLELHYWDEMTTADMAAVIGRPQGTIKRHLQQARARLERAMAELAGSPELLRSTLSDLASWAAACRAAMAAADKDSP